MARVNSLFVIALLFCACDISFSPYSELETGTPADSDGGSGREPDGGVDPGPVVCGSVGTYHQAGFSYVDCSTNSFALSTFTQQIAVGGTASIFVDSPIQHLDHVGSSDPTIATFVVAPPDADASIPSTWTILATGVGAGSVTISLYTAANTLIDQSTVTVAQALSTLITGGPASASAAILSGTTTTICATPTTAAPGPGLQPGQSPISGTIVAVIGPQLISSSSTGAAVGSVSPMGVDFASSFWSVPMGVCDEIGIASGASGSFVVQGPGNGESLQLSGVTLADITTATASPASLSIPAGSTSEVLVTALAGSLPVLGTSCDWATPSGLQVAPMASKFLGGPSDGLEVLVTPGQRTGSFTITCNINGTHVSVAIPVTVTPAQS